MKGQRGGVFSTPVYIVRSCAASYSQELPDGVPTMQPGDLSQWIADRRVQRRMGRLSRTALEAAFRCLSDAGSLAAIITATGYGFLDETEKFMQAFLECQEHLVPPTAFIQSTFNTIGAQLAHVKGMHVHNSTHVQGNVSLECAMFEGVGILQSAEEQQVLVGAFDERTPMLETMLGAMEQASAGEIGEGVAFFLLSNRCAGDAVEIRAMHFCPEELPREAALSWLEGVSGAVDRAHLYWVDDFEGELGYCTSLSAVAMHRITERLQPGDEGWLVNAGLRGTAAIQLRRVC